MRYIYLAGCDRIQYVRTYDDMYVQSYKVVGKLYQSSTSLTTQWHSHPLCQLPPLVKNLFITSEYKWAYI